jgi:outer membrane protein
MIKRSYIYIAIILLVFSAQTFAITMKESVDAAFNNNPQLLSAQKKLNASEARLGQARSYLMPTIAVTGATGQSYQQPMSILIGTSEFSTTPDKAADISTYSLTLSQMLYNGGAINGMAIAYYSFLSSKEDLRRTKQDVAYKVASGYYGVINAEKAHSILQDSVKSLKRYVAQMNVFYDADMATKADVLRVQTQLESTRQQEILAKSAEQVSRLSFNSLLGMPLTSETEPITEEAVSSRELPSLDKLLDIAYLQRPDWISFKLAEQTADAGLSVAYTGYLPTLALSGSYGRTVSSYADYPESDSNLLSWRALLTGSWTLFDGLNTSNKVEEAYNNLQALRADKQTLSDAIALDVTSTYYELMSTYERIEAARSAEDMARKMMRFAEMNFDQRIYTSTQLLDSQTTYHKAQSDLLSAQYDLELAKAKLDKAVGIDIFSSKI